MATEENVDSRDGGPLPMQFFSTWEVRKVPANCMSRLCTLNITRLEILKSIEEDLQSVVLAISMKTPHRSLRSNELQVPATGLMNITLNLTFALQYPHFFKRGGNTLEIRLQRRKRYRNRTIRGYKTLLRGAVNMGLVLQRSFQGMVSLFSDKSLDHMANVMLGSITSVPTEMEMKHNIAADVSSEEEDDVISEDDTDSMENMDPRGYDEEGEPHEEEAKISLKQPSSVLKLLKLKAKGRHRGRDVPVEVTLGIEEEEEEEEGGVEGARSVVLSSLSDSYEDDDDESPTHDQATPRPRLRPFFGSDTLSLMSGTQMPGDIDGSLHGVVGAGGSRYDTRYGSLELAGMAHRATHSQSPSEILEPLDIPERGLIKGRLWLLDEASTKLHNVLYSMDEPLLTTPTHPTSSSFISLLNTLGTLWKKDTPFLLILDEGHALLAALIRAYVFGPSFPCNFFQFTDHMISGGGVRRMLFKDSEEDELSRSQDIISDFIASLINYSMSTLLPIAQVEISTVTPSSTLEKSPNKKYIPFIHNVSIGPWESDSKLDTSGVPHSPSSPPTSEHSSEILLEYWNGKQKSSAKVRSIMITVVSGSLLNVSAIIRSKKTLRIRRSKDTGSEGSIMSLSASHLSCRSTSKGEELTACIDGVEWKSFDAVKLSAQWDHSLKAHLPVLTIDSEKSITFSPHHT